MGRVWTRHFSSSRARVHTAATSRSVRSGPDCAVLRRVLSAITRRRLGSNCRRLPSNCRRLGSNHRRLTAILRVWACGGGWGLASGVWVWVWERGRG